MEIKSIELTRLRNDAHFQFHTYAAELIAEEGASELNIAALFNSYKANLAKEDEAFKRIDKSDITDKIHAADKARDSVYKVFASAVKTALKHYKPEIAEAAKRLKIVIGTYGDINRKSYDEQTSAVYNILQEFNGKYRADAEIIGIYDMVEELEIRNKAMDALIKKRMNEASKKNTGNLKTIRMSVDKYYLDIRKRINAAVVIEGEENYSQFISKMNVLVDRYKKLLARVRKAGKNNRASSNSSGDESGKFLS